MSERSNLAEAIAPTAKTHFARAIAFLWFYRHSGEYLDRTAAELAKDLQNEDFPKPRVSRLHLELANSRYTVKGSRVKSFKINRAYAAELDKRYSSLVNAKRAIATESILPSEWVADTRKNLEKLAYQINGSYYAGFYDGCAVLMRRLMETLIIETYVHKSRSDEIKTDGNFRPLDWLISKAINDSSLHLNRNSKRSMGEIKHLGDTAAHDRNYITRQTNIDDLKPRYMKLIHELLNLAGFQK